MARQEQLYVGNLQVGDRELYGEVWAQGDAAIVLNAQEGVITTLHDVTIGLVDGTSQLQVTGTDTDDKPVTVTAMANEQVMGTWQNANVQMPDGSLLPKATVTWTQYRVSVRAKNVAEQHFAGATARAYSGVVLIDLADGSTIRAETPSKADCTPCSGG